MKPKIKTQKLALHQETLRQLSERTLGDVGGGAGPKPIGVFSDGRLCTGDPFCTGVLTCSFRCK